MILWASERIFVLSVGILATASLVVFGGRETAVRPVATLPGSVMVATYEPPNTGIIAGERQQTWAGPPALSRGREWVYEVFTPPEIFYDVETHRFRVAGNIPAAEVNLSSESRDFGIELVAIEAAEFPLQLVGYIGEPGTYQGIFVNVETAETFLGATGRRVPELGLIIDTFDVTRKTIAIEEGMSVVELIAEARVRHEARGEEIVLNDRTRTMKGVRRVRLRIAQDEGSDWVAEEGEVRRIEGDLYRIEKIRLAPASVTISKESAGATASEVRTLTPPVTASDHMQ